MLSSRDQRGLETKLNGLVLVLVLVLMHLGLVVSKFNYAKYLLFVMVTYNSGLKCQSDGTNRKLNTGC